MYVTLGYITNAINPLGDKIADDYQKKTENNNNHNVGQNVVRSLAAINQNLLVANVLCMM